MSKIKKEDLREGTALVDKESGMVSIVASTKEVVKGCYRGFYVMLPSKTGLHGYTEYCLTEIRAFFNLKPSTNP